MGSLDALLKAEIGFTVDESISEIERRILFKEQSQRKLGKVGNPTGNNQYTDNEGRKGYDCNNSTETRGNNPDYLLDRIERDFPETYQDIKDGKFRSTRQAAISVGIVKKDDRWTAPGPVERSLAEEARERQLNAGVFGSEGGRGNKKDIETLSQNFEQGLDKTVSQKFNQHKRPSHTTRPRRRRGCVRLQYLTFLMIRQLGKKFLNRISPKKSYTSKTNQQLSWLRCLANRLIIFVYPVVFS